ncbi:MAG: ATP-dependent helicase Lhr and Lhr-like helicase, partial [Verrucomicrobiales bacterium]|nr:ATP-dependent helicase Lhr and Lhr-like helicase [Verrucomicrobiales bacterium]
MSTTAFSLLDPRLQKEIYRMGWTHLRPIQEQAIRLILRGQNHLLICAQTAGGKTEAAFLPVLSQVAALPKPSVQALYISPLKALINDQSNRLEQLSEGLKVPVHRWHGDVSNAQKRRFRQTPSGILMITPESLESNFINYGSQMAGIYEHLEFVVVDELHSFLEDVRGIHLKSLLSRLLTAIGRKPRFIGLSATLSDTLAAQRFLSPDNPEQVDCIADPAPRREIQLAIKTYLRRPRSRTETTLEPRLAPGTALELVQSLDAEAFAGETPLNQETAPQLAPVPVEEQARKEEELDEIAEDIFRHCKDSTNLVFINDKATIETLAVGLRERVQAAKLPVDPFCVHHGSLSKELREEAENKLKTAGNATAICSGTLELGID